MVELTQLPHSVKERIVIPLCYAGTTGSVLPLYGKSLITYLGVFAWMELFRSNTPKVVLLSFPCGTLYF